MTNWDDAYAITKFVPGAAELLESLPGRSAAFRDTLGDRAETYIPYGATDRQVFDMFQPDCEPRGTLVFIHGGYWRIMHSSAHSFLAAGALARGWAVAMPSYDQCPAVHIRDISRQIAQAVGVIADRTSGPISITGHSAGGHLAARMLDPDLVTSGVAERLHAVVPIAPLADLRPLMKTAMNDDLNLDADEARAESPVLMEHRHPACVAVCVGANERPALLDQARWLSEAWRVDQIIAPGKHHFDVIDALCDPDSALMRVLTG